MDHTIVLETSWALLEASLGPRGVLEAPWGTGKVSRNPWSQESANDQHECSGPRIVIIYRYMICLAF